MTFDEWYDDPTTQDGFLLAEAKAELEHLKVRYENRSLGFDAVTRELAEAKAALEKAEKALAKIQREAYDWCQNGSGRPHHFFELSEIAAEALKRPTHPEPESREQTGDVEAAMNEAIPCSGDPHPRLICRAKDCPIPDAPAHCIRCHPLDATPPASAPDAKVAMTRAVRGLLVDAVEKIEGGWMPSKLWTLEARAALKDVGVVPPQPDAYHTKPPAPDANVLAAQLAQRDVEVERLRAALSGAIMLCNKTAVANTLAAERKRGLEAGGATVAATIARELGEGIQQIVAALKETKP